ncbi:MAG: CocE/NonD family hydrolase [Rhizobiaceae bacterium]
MKTVTEFPRKTVELPDVGIIMPDGTRLSARIWMPVDAASDPVPAIIEHLPYRKRDGTIARDSLTHPYFAGHGYACIRVDMRGNGDSDGLMVDEYTQTELDDACAVHAWAAAQDWCNGNTGMMGISWGGFNALQVAALNPPSLKAVIALCSTVDRYADDIHYKGGCLLGENFGWSANMLSYSSRPPDPALVGDRWREMWMKRLENLPMLISIWLRHQHRDAYWKHGSVCEDYAAIKAAVLSLGGWHDGYRNTPAHLVENIQSPVKAIVGPWIHKYPHFAAPEPRIGFLQEALRWWDRWLKGIDTGVEHDPAYRAWLMDSIAPAPWLPERPGRWIVEKHWPSAAINTETLHMTDTGLSPTAGILSKSISSPQDCGLAAGEYFPFTYGPELPDEQSEDDRRSLVFDGAPLTEGKDIVGAPKVSLRFSSDQPDALVCVRLCDLFPDGRSALITYGYLNLTHHASHEHPEPLQAGKLYGASLALDQIAYRIPAGHRLRVAISTASWPSVWPSPRKAKVTLSAASFDLPIRPTANGSEWTFAGPEAAPAWRVENIRRARSTRKTERMPDGAVVLKVFNDFGCDRALDHGLETGSHTEEIWSIQPDDPLSARAEIRWEQTSKRASWSTRTETTSEFWSDHNHFHMTGSVKAYEGAALVFERRYQDKIKRDCV